MAATRTVLLVDDDRMSLTLMRGVLQRRGYNVLMASDGNLGLALAEQHSPDLVVVDLMMPGRSGFFVLQKLKSRQEGAPPVIMITADEGDRHRLNAQRLGADDYLRKPFDADQLVQAVERLCPPAGNPVGNHAE